MGFVFAWGAKLQTAEAIIAGVNGNLHSLYPLSEGEEEVDEVLVIDVVALLESIHDAGDFSLVGHRREDRVPSASMRGVGGRPWRYGGEGCP